MPKYHHWCLDSPLIDTGILFYRGYMKRIEVKSKGSIFFAEISDCDYNLVSAYNWILDTPGYPSTKIKMPCGHYESVTMHKLIMGRGKNRMSVDHIDRNKLNNQRENLRFCTQQQNILNRGMQKNNTSGFRGVKMNRNFIVAQIRVGGKTIHIGTFKTKKDAAIAYDKVAIQYHGEYAMTNKSLGLL